MGRGGGKVDVAEAAAKQKKSFFNVIVVMQRSTEGAFLPSAEAKAKGF